MLGATTEQVKKLGLFGYPSIISIATIITGSFFLFDRNLETSDTLNLLYSCSTIFVLFLMTCIIWYFATLLRKIKLPKLPLRAPNELDESKNGQEYTPLVTDVWIIKKSQNLFFFQKIFFDSILVMSHGTVCTYLAYGMPLWAIFSW